MTTKKQRGGGRGTSKRRATTQKTKRASRSASAAKPARNPARRASTAKARKATTRTPRKRLEKLLGRAWGSVMKTGRSVRESGETAIRMARRRVVGS